MDVKDSQEYNELLYKAGRTANNLKVFIDTLIESGIVSKKDLRITQEYLRAKLLTEDVQDVLSEYNAKCDDNASKIKNECNIDFLRIYKMIDEELRKM